MGRSRGAARLNRRLATGQAHHSEDQSDRRDGLSNPEEEHPLDEACFEPGHTGLYATFQSPDVCFDFRDPALELRVELRDPLLQLGIESPEVQLVELTQIGSIRGVPPC